MENELLKLEKQYWEGMANMDYDVVRNLTKFPCIVAGKKGVMRVDESQFKQMFDQGKGQTIQVKSISGSHFQEGSYHGMIGYIIEMDYDGQSMKCVCTSTWVKEDGNWKCAMHTECDLKSEMK